MPGLSHSAVLDAKHIRKNVLGTLKDFATIYSSRAEMPHDTLAYPVERYDLPKGKASDAWLLTFAITTEATIVRQLAELRNYLQAGQRLAATVRVEDVLDLIESDSLTVKSARRVLLLLTKVEINWPPEYQEDIWAKIEAHERLIAQVAARAGVSRELVEVAGIENVVGDYD